MPPPAHQDQQKMGVQQAKKCPRHVRHQARLPMELPVAASIQTLPGPEGRTMDLFRLYPAGAANAAGIPLSAAEMSFVAEQLVLRQTGWPSERLIRLDVTLGPFAGSFVYATDNGAPFALITATPRVIKTL